MNRETLLGKGYTEEQVTDLLNTFHTSNKEKETEKERVERELQEAKTKLVDYDSLKTKISDIEKQNMSNEEKNALKTKEIEDNLKQSKMILNTAKAKEVLAGLDLDDDLIATLVSEDDAKTLSNAQKLLTKLNDIRVNTEKKTKEEIANLDVKPPITNVPQGTGAMTWENFEKLPVAEQNKWANENPTEFNKF